MIIILCARICLRWESDNGRTNYGYNKKKITAPNIKYRQKAGKFFVLRTTNVLVVDDVVDIFLFLYYSCVSGWKERDVTWKVKK